MKTSRITTRLVTAFGLAAMALFSSANAAVTPGGTIGDSATFTTDTGVENQELLPGAVDNADGPEVALTHKAGTGDATYELNPSAADESEIALSSGLHLILYNAQFNDDTPVNGGNRTEVISKLNLAGSDIAIGHSQGYTRDASGADEAITTGGAIVNVGADDDILKLVSFRSDSNMNATPQDLSRVNSAIQLLKLDDSWDYLSLSKAADDASSTGSTFTGVSYDTVGANTGSAFTYSGTGSDVTLNATGLYLVCANTGVEKPDNGTRTNFQQRLTLDGAAVPGTTTTTYMRGDPDAGQFVSCNSGVTAIATVISNDLAGRVLNVQVASENGPAATVAGGRTGITIVKLPDSAECISLFEDAALQNINPSAPSIGFNDAATKSSSAFSHDPTGTIDDTAVVTINTDGEYLFLSNLFSSVSPQRAVVQNTLAVNFVNESLIGRGAAYNRGLADSNLSGSWSGALLDLLATDAVELVTTAIGAGGTATADEISLFGLRLGSVFPGPTPLVTVNGGLGLTVNEGPVTIDDTLLKTVDTDTPDADLTYTATNVSGGTLSPTTFTQDQVNINGVTFTAGATPDPTGGFDFTVSDGTTTYPATGTLRFNVVVVEAIVVTNESGGVDEDTVANEGNVGNLLSNDTGDALTVTSFDSTSTFGIPVNVNPDGTFTYDPTKSVLAQSLGGGDTSPADTFTYTVTDSVGKTAVGTVSITVTGVEDAIGAVPDSVAGALEDAIFASTTDLTANDGPVGEGLLLNYDARTTAGTGTWENVGPVSPGAVWSLTDVTLNATPGGTRAQITAAYEWDSTLDRALMTGPGGDSINDIVTGDPDASDATWEYWVRPATGFESSVMTIFETGGGGGFGMAIDNGVLIAATELDGGNLSGSATSYDLVADPLNVIPGAAGAVAVAADFHQFAASIDTNDGGVALYINGVLVDETTTGSSTDWDGGDGAGLGIFNGANHGGFINTAATAAGGKWNAPFLGQMAIVRLYEGILTNAQIIQNFNGVNTGLDVEGDTLQVAGIFDTTLTTSFGPVSLPSGGIVDLDVNTTAGNTGAFSYDPNGAFDSLVAGEFGTDTFTYQITDSGSAGGQTASADVTVEIGGTNQSVDDVLTVFEGTSVTFPASAIVGNDDHGIGTSAPLVNLDGRALANPWVNTGSTGVTHDVNVGSGSVVPGDSNFGALGDTWDGLSGTLTSLDGAIGAGDLTFEIWFKPTFSSGKQLLFETGGGGNGCSIIFDADSGEVIFTGDGGTNTDPNVQVEIRATGVTYGEFNQVVIVHDVNSPTIEDTTTMYLNNDPTAFNGTPAATFTNTGGGVNDIIGADGASIGANNSAIALDTPGVGDFQGQIGLFRAYGSALSAGEIEDNFDAIVQPIQSTGGTPTVTPTLNLDGSFTYDASSVVIGTDVADIFTYTISDGAGGTTTATVTVNVINQGAVIAIDDEDASVLESDGAMSFDPTGNDTFPGGSTVELQSFEADALADLFSSTGALTHGDPADFTGSTGWRYLWNAPTGWVDGTADTTTFTWSGSTGPLSSTADWDLLVWDSTVVGFLVDADGVGGPDAGSEPGAYLRLSDDGTGIPGLGSAQAGTVGNTEDRYLILEYEVPTTGYYGIANSSITKTSGLNTGLEVVGLNNGIAQYSSFIAPAATGGFDGELGFLSAGQKLQVAIGPDTNRGNDNFTDLAFEVVMLPSATSLVNDIVGTVSTDGSTITYDPAGMFENLAAGQTTTETITYTIRNGGDTSTANWTVTITGENDAPLAVADTNATDEDTPVAGDVLGNDTDIDQGDALNLSVVQVQGLVGNVGTPTTTTGGGTVTLLADGTYIYDPGAAYQYLAVGESANDFFTYLCQDAGGLDSPVTATVTITVTGTEDGVTATDDSYTGPNTSPISGNLITDDTGSGVDISVDTSNVLSILDIDTSLVTLGTLEVSVPGQIGVFGTESAVTDAGTIVNYGGGFTNPVFIFGPPSDNEVEPSIVKFEEINATSFELSIKEQPEGGAFADIGGATHAAETVSWAVIEAGTYRLPNGALMEVGTISTSAIRHSGGPSSWQTVNFSADFLNPPAVITSLQTFDSDLSGADAELFGTRINSNSITPFGFQVALEDVQGDVNARVFPETIGYIAIEAASGGIAGTPFEVGITTQSVTDEFFTINFSRDVGAAPAFFAQLASYFGVDPSQGRFRNLSGTSAQVRSAEDTFGDDEGDPGIGDPPAGFPEFSEGHAAEVFHYVVIGGGSGPILAHSTDDLGSFTYTPNPGASGTDTFTYTLTDGYGNTSTATVTINVDAVTDSDGDGIPDAYEDADSFLSSTDGTDAGSDFDLDGTTALQEYLFGTLADDQNSVFTIQVTDVNLGADTVEITYGPVVAGLTYDLNANLVGPDEVWSQLETGFVPGSDGANGADGANRVFTKSGVNPGEIFHVEVFGNELP